MNFRKWVCYFFMDHKRFWICFDFYILCGFLPIFKFRLVRRILGERLVVKYSLYCMEIQCNTLKYKLEVGDSK